jgi:putative N6-adenine-specific DNA methylase
VDETATNIAPINEVLAAGVLLLSGWDGQGDFLDQCGLIFWLKLL